MWAPIGTSISDGVVGVKHAGEAAPRGQDEYRQEVQDRLVQDLFGACGAAICASCVRCLLSTDAGFSQIGN
jgi:hypothetical protein